jgi:hypothetical protein
MSEATKRLSEDQLDGLRATYKKIAIIEFNDHVLVFRRPTRDECHAYRVKTQSPETKADANEQLCQSLIVAFDTDTNVVSARTHFTTVFLEEVPMFAAGPKVWAALGALMGLVEEEDQVDMGKGVTIKPLPRPRTPKDSQTGSPTAHGEPS